LAVSATAKDSANIGRRSTTTVIKASISTAGLTTKYFNSIRLDYEFTQELDYQLFISISAHLLNGISHFSNKQTAASAAGIRRGLCRPG
jgi:hypothetical protein